MRVTEVQVIPLRGATPEGGWDTELAADDNVHCLLELVTDAGLSGLGSVFTSGGLVEDPDGIARHGGGGGRLRIAR